MLVLPKNGTNAEFNSLYSRSYRAYKSTFGVCCRRRRRRRHRYGCCFLVALLLLFVCLFHSRHIVCAHSHLFTLFNGTLNSSQQKDWGGGGQRALASITYISCLYIDNIVIPLSIGPRISKKINFLFVLRLSHS